jgi:serine/threonine protein kinase
MCYFFFDYPADAGDAEPQSLYDLIRSTNPDYKLDLAQRFHIARTVARTLGAFHCDGWVHKGVRAKAIKFFFDKQGENCGFSRPYLTEFEISRPDAGDTYLEPTLRDMEHDVYRHPLRYGLPTKRFTKTHDIYSLGVVLLEIGLWCTATDIHDDLIKENFDGNAPPEGVTGALMQETLVSKAKTQLRHQMGAAYEDAVMSCLNCELDSFLYGPDFASEFQSRIVEKVDMKALIGWSQTHRADESVVEGG